MTIGQLQNGKIVAVKGIGGFHIMVDATNADAVLRLRQLKKRPTKPFAILYPSLKKVRQDCEVSEFEASCLESPEAPIVLLRRREAPSICSDIAPQNPYLGILLPSNPLHHLLMEDFPSPLVATSGNLSEEPICVDEREAVQRLGNIVDGFLVHNRPVARYVDDSIVREVQGRALVLRRSRGLSPFVRKHSNSHGTYLALGGHLKNTTAFSFAGQTLVSQHIGDLGNDLALEAFKKTIQDSMGTYDRKPSTLICDAHPDYASTIEANRLDLPVVTVQHHYAHVLSCLADNESKPPVLGVAWDGSGYGSDGTIWGGEFLKLSKNSFKRIATLYPFRLPGGEGAIRDNRRIGLSLLFELRRELGDITPFTRDLGFSAAESRILIQMLEGGVQSPVTTSVGRLFDGVAALLGVCRSSTFEGEAASSLEYAVSDCSHSSIYEFALIEEKTALVDWRSIVLSLLEEKRRGVPISEISTKFHNTLVEIIVQIAKWSGEKKIALTGGCFQNRYLLEHSINGLRNERLSVLWHKDLPPNDGGLALGQIEAMRLAPSLQNGGRFPCA